ncbi:Xaa-Pro peptidase family protein [Desulfococcaceae bacterium HSG9]|nr:Xaa-Pro peptidase family protein [Desulfococcaceae bacterium HSG9]
MLLNKDRAYDVMEKYDIEAIVATMPENVTYLTDFWSLTHRLIKATQNFAVITRKKDVSPFIITSIGDMDLAADQEECQTDNFLTYGTFYVECPADVALNNTEKRYQSLLTSSKPKKDAVTALIECLSELGVTKGKIAFDEGNITPYAYNTITGNLSDIEFIQGYQILREIRLIKTQTEVNRLERSSEIIESGIKHALSAIQEGVTEFEIWQTLFKKVLEEGALPSWPCVGVGTRGGLSNVISAPHPIKKGDLIRFDVGCLYKYYNSDCARTVVLGETNEKQRSYHHAVQTGLEKALGIVRPGVRASEIFKEAVEGVRDAGIPHYRRHHVGHGIGIEPYEQPFLSATSEDILEEGMVVNVETPYYEMGLGGIQLEDTILVTADGYRALTKSPRDLLVV